MERKRIFGRQYELARVYAPKQEGMYIWGKRKELKACEGRSVYESLRQDERMARNYDEQLRYQYLREMFFTLSTRTPIIVKMVGGIMAVPTNEIEQEQFPWKECECIELSLRVMLEQFQVPIVEQMMAIVEKKMRSFKTDFLFHDMKTMARELGSRPMLWVVGGSHTFLEVHDAEELAKAWMDTDQESRRRHFLYGGEDDTWIGAALRVSIGRDDLLYYIDKAGALHKVSREKFTEIHARYVESVRAIAREKLEPKVA